jgi:hypothetical protein
MHLILAHRSDARKQDYIAQNSNRMRYSSTLSHLLRKQSDPRFLAVRIRNRSKSSRLDFDLETRLGIITFPISCPALFFTQHDLRGVPAVPDKKLSRTILNVLES